MPAPATPLAFDPAIYLRPAFTALNWAGMVFEAAMNDPTRRDIIEFIAIRWPEQPMHHIVSISRIDWLATDAARRTPHARDANPYPEQSPAGGLFAKCFEAEKTRMAQAVRAQAAIELVAIQETA